ncbi:MAG: nucleotide exchange factor GrpE [Christensenellaceae bacterium]|jgi:molecular chaperone GrpE|nr:nucleotide exchange factor GrpE [Christensenellaceae bacterium]
MSEKQENSTEEKIEALKEDEQILEFDVQSEIEAKVNEYKSMAQRIQAEFDNYRKRTNDSVRLARLDGGNDVILSILPVADAVERALLMLTDKSAIEGVGLIKKQLSSLFSKYDISEIGTEYENFNPQLHNAIMKVDDPENCGRVVEVLQKGYSRSGKVIRYAMVKVAN